ncbi:MAG: right-handed parallel beta-helix repeat-containing protein [Candidatus Hodarchaeales archaeon]
MNIKSLKTQTRMPTTIGVELQQYTAHEPIFINYDDEFSYQGFPGSGTINDPFRIEGLNITSTESDLITIKETQVHFTIRNNILNGLSRASSGIEFFNVWNGIIENNLILNHKSEGLIISGSQDNIIRNNTIKNNSNGIKVVRSGFTHPRNNIIINNTIHYNMLRGILIDDALESTISDNRISSNQFMGISLQNCENISLTSNIISSNSFQGVFLDSSHQCNISNNTITDNDNEGVYLSGSHQANITENTISNNNRFGIFFSDSNSSWIVNNNITDNKEYGILLDAFSGDDTIRGNTFIGNNKGGIAQACDEGEGNVFINNSWDDWSSTYYPYPIHRTRIHQGENYINQSDFENPFTVPPHIFFGIVLLVIIGSLLVSTRRQYKY